MNETTAKPSRNHSQNRSETTVKAEVKPQPEPKRNHSQNRSVTKGHRSATSRRVCYYCYTSRMHTTAQPRTAVSHRDSNLQIMKFENIIVDKFEKLTPRVTFYFKIESQSEETIINIKGFHWLLFKMKWLPRGEMSVVFFLPLRHTSMGQRNVVVFVNVLLVVLAVVFVDVLLVVLAVVFVNVLLVVLVVVSSRVWS